MKKKKVKFVNKNVFIEEIEKATNLNFQRAFIYVMALIEADKAVLSLRAKLMFDEIKEQYRKEEKEYVKNNNRKTASR